MDEQVGRIRPLLVQSSTVDNCSGCESKFKLHNIKYHCRACGKVFCGRCCSKEIALPYMENETGRVCSYCFHQVKKYSYLTHVKESDIGRIAPIWVYDAPLCMQCGVEFTLSMGDINCRGCGKRLCERCCSHKTALAYADMRRLPVCSPCFKTVQKKASLDGSNLGLVAPFWIPDGDTPSCMRCDKKFTFSTRRHHCRACGQVVCSTCCSEKTVFAYLQMKFARVCNKCHLQVRERGIPDEPNLGLVAPFWIPDDDTPTCMQCDKKFTLTTRRHHCRACGQVVCSTCCSEKTSFAYLQMKFARVCNKCHLRAYQNSWYGEGVPEDQQEPQAATNPRNQLEFKMDNFKNIFRNGVSANVLSEDTSQEAGSRSNRFQVLIKITHLGENDCIWAVDIIEAVLWVASRVFNQVIESIHQYDKDEAGNMKVMC